jgi:succinate dehydrogenase/fumarate reductase flavoprotein subunit
VLRRAATETIDADVAVGGGASLRAAYDAAAADPPALLVLKGQSTASGATAFVVAELAGFAVHDDVGDLPDSPVVHFDDITRVGPECNDPRLVRVLRVEFASGRFHDADVMQLAALSAAKNLLDVGTVVIAAARVRKEAHRSHCREDDLHTDAHWEGSVIIHQTQYGSEATAGSFAELIA